MINKLHNFGVIVAISLFFAMCYVAINGCGIPQPRSETMCYKSNVGWIKCPKGIEPGSEI